MSKEIQRYVKHELAKPDSTIKSEAGGTLALIGGGGLVAYGAAGLIPFINFPALLIVLLVLGGYLKFKD